MMEIEVIKTLTALLNKLRKLIPLGSVFINHHASIEEEDMESESAWNSACYYSNPVHTPSASDATGENAVKHLIKHEKLIQYNN